MESRTLTRIIGLTVWRFSENPVLHWDPKNLEKGLRKVLDMIISGQFNDVKGLNSKIISMFKNYRTIFSHELNFYNNFRKDFINDSETYRRSEKFF